jgi:hypothetical protein
MMLSGRQWHGELVSLYVVGVGRKQPSRRMREEFQPDREGRRALKQRRLFLQRQIGDGLEVQRDRFPKGRKRLVKGPTLNRYIEVETDRLPAFVPAFGVAV